MADNWQYHTSEVLGNWELCYQSDAVRDNDLGTYAEHDHSVHGTQGGKIEFLLGGTTKTDRIKVYLGGDATVYWQFWYWDGDSWVIFAWPAITVVGWYEYAIGSEVETTKFAAAALNDMGEYSEVHEFMYNLLGSVRPKVRGSLASGKRGLIL